MLNSKEPEAAMSENIPDPAPLAPERDGTRQSQRILPSLDPETVSLDGRSLEDCLAFAYAYSRELNYFNMDNQPTSDWVGLLNPNGLDIKDLTAQWRGIHKFLAEPEIFDHNCPYRRPHFLLFVIFLHLLGLTRLRINQLTRKHLDFYYQTYLSLTKQAGRPDRVNILAKPTADTAQTRLPAGTLLLAGQDSRGDDLFYRTDAELIVNQAQVKRLSSVFVDKKITGIRESREACLKHEDDPLLAMFAIVYGEPAPGDPLPPYPDMDLKQAVDGNFLGLLKNLVDFVGSRLHMEFQQFHRMMQLKNQRRQSADSDWKLINPILNKIGEAKWKPEPFKKIEPENSPDFDNNLEKALKGKPNFSKLGGDIKTMEDLYRQIHRVEVRTFIKTDLFLELDDFKTMMKRKTDIDYDWRNVNALLVSAGRVYHNKADFTLGNLFSPAFEDNIVKALGEIEFPVLKALVGIDCLDRFHAELSTVEAYFHCRLEDFAHILGTWQRAKGILNKPTTTEWESVYAILTKAYTEKVYTNRRAQLVLSRGPEANRSTDKDALVAMLRLVLGRRDWLADKLADHLADYWPNEASQNTLNIILKILNGEIQGNNEFSLTEQDWPDIVANLELAWRKREGKEPVAQKVEWLNLYANAEATAVRVSHSMDTQQRWPTFGQVRPAQSQQPKPLLGWSIASPVFRLSQGSRTVKLTLNFQPTEFDQQKFDRFMEKTLADFLQIEASSAKGWVAVAAKNPPSSIEFIPTKTNPSESADNKVKLKLDVILTLSLDESFPPIAALPSSESPWPLIRLMLLSKLQDQVYVMPLYPLMQDLLLEQVLIGVTVKGLSDLRMENDEGSLSAGKPFEPFGSNPSAGSGFLFTHPELVAKRLDTLSAKLEWMQVPDKNLGMYYQNYPGFVSKPEPVKHETFNDPSLGNYTNSSFTAKLVLVNHRLENNLDDKAALFDAEDARKVTSITFITKKNKDNCKACNDLAEVDPFNQPDPSSCPRHWRIELNDPDFQHGNYARVSAAMSLEWSAAIAASIKDPKVPLNPVRFQVNPPYTPKLKSFSVDYTGSTKIIMNPVKAHAPNQIDDTEIKESELLYGTGEERMFHLHAFGYAEIQPEQNAGLYRFLPAYDHAGELYIGLEAVAAPQDVAFLFQLADGSANPDVPPQRVQWSYLSGNRWVSLHDGGILADSTAGLVGTGIIQFRLPIAKPNTLLPANLYWLRVAVAQYCDSVCDTIAIHTQAVSATWVDRGNAPDHLERPLPSGSIKKTPDGVPDIQSISQPYSSYGGKQGERAELFNRRVSERLRHKQRALTYWDYEHLILERFPDIYQAKCIPSPLMEPSELGKVVVVVIPDIHDCQPFNPFEPKATARQIAEITGFLSSHAPPLAEIKVKNAHYVPVRVRFAVRFMPSCDPGFYKPRLNEELNRYLSPWAYAESNEVTICGKIYANAIVDFLERRPYVDYVAGIKLFKNEDGRHFTLVEQKKGDAEGYHVKTDRRDGVLVADRQHVIDLITDIRYHEEKFIGIGYLKIELDFIIKE